MPKKKNSRNLLNKEHVHMEKKHYEISTNTRDEKQGNWFTVREDVKMTIGNQDWINRSHYHPRSLVKFHTLYMQDKKKEQSKHAIFRLRLHRIMLL